MHGLSIIELSAKLPGYKVAVHKSINRIFCTINFDFYIHFSPIPVT